MMMRLCAIGSVMVYLLMHFVAAIARVSQVLSALAEVDISAEMLFYVDYDYEFGARDADVGKRVDAVVDKVGLSVLLEVVYAW